VITWKFYWKTNRCDEKSIEKRLDQRALRRHTQNVSALAEQMRTNLPAEFWVRQELPLTFASSEPEPDLSVVRGRAADFKTEHPRMAALVVEVSVTSVELDREKARIYARAGIPEYWLVEPQRKIVTVHRTPDLSAAQYAQVFEAGAGDRLAAPVGREIDLSSIF